MKYSAQRLNFLWKFSSLVFFLFLVFSCVCPLGMTGDKCDVNMNRCLSNPCRNGGRCVPRENDFYCLCSYPYDGNLCQTDTDPCFPNPCLYGGSCIYDNQAAQGYTCNCAPGFIGEDYYFYFGIKYIVAD